MSAPVVISVYADILRLKLIFHKVSKISCKEYSSMFPVYFLSTVCIVSLSVCVCACMFLEVSLAYWHFITLL